MNISFALTQNQLLDGSKTETRRLWKLPTVRQFRINTLHNAFDKMAFVRGARKLAIIRATADAYFEPLAAITPAAVVAEGFPDWTPEQFIAFFLAEANKKRKPGELVTPDTEIVVAKFQLEKVLIYG